MRTGVVDAGDRVTWSYDSNYRLTREQRDGDEAYDITYTFDAVGNRLTKLTGGVTTSYTYNAGDALTVENAGGTLTTNTWDDAGNNTVVNAAGDLTTMTWDAENRLSVIALPSNEILTMTYDATGLRRSRQDSSGTIDFVWDLENLLMELSGASTQAQYTTGLGPYGPVLSQRRSSTSTYMLTDALGTVTRLLDSSESVTDSYIMDAFGNSIASTGSTVNPFRYVGGLGYYDEPDLPANYVRARWLRNRTGSWMSVDPVPSEPRYLYVNGSPAMATDGSGMASCRAAHAACLRRAEDGWRQCLTMGGGRQHCSRLWDAEIAQCVHVLNICLAGGPVPVPAPPASQLDPKLVAWGKEREEIEDYYRPLIREQYERFRNPYGPTISQLSDPHGMSPRTREPSGAWGHQLLPAEIERNEAINEWYRNAPFEWPDGPPHIPLPDVRKRYEHYTTLGPGREYLPDPMNPRE